LNSELLLRGALIIGGLLTAMIGIGHIFMPTLGYDRSVSMAMEPAIREHFYYLGTYAICAFLLSLAFLSIYFSRIEYSRASLVVGSVLAVLWIARAILEFIYPVEIRIFFLQTPHGVLLSVVVFLAFIYSFSALSAWTAMARSKPDAQSDAPNSAPPNVTLGEPGGG
jgi:hypothetical protein